MRYRIDNKVYDTEKASSIWLIENNVNESSEEYFRTKKGTFFLVDKTDDGYTINTEVTEMEPQEVAEKICESKNQTAIDKRLQYFSDHPDILTFMAGEEVQ